MQPLPSVDDEPLVQISPAEAAEKSGESKAAAPAPTSPAQPGPVGTEPAPKPASPTGSQKAAGSPAATAAAPAPQGDAAASSSPAARPPSSQSKKDEKVSIRPTFIVLLLAQERQDSLISQEVARIRFEKEQQTP